MHNVDTVKRSEDDESGLQEMRSLLEKFHRIREQRAKEGIVNYFGSQQNRIQNGQLNTVNSHLIILS